VGGETHTVGSRLERTAECFLALTQRFLSRYTLRDIGGKCEHALDLAVLATMRHQRDVDMAETAGGEVGDAVVLHGLSG